ncbi:iron-sulfur cluster carrier protein ApbC [Veronia nyctiphanis]|uniref:Iron-sulfur cluster carrier protein n=1 Tax=Veronia nyctiphanis TaxID=1278244 RepID=A0A4Q0YRA7_9GAMM|nr:iron-sulfur cluster carrier protein ApbC [Veronia nyctiphanis]RXJ73632.1 iron-sulfur cluster carrier protein ApbC [Veronia nyctiphanis]
MFFGRNKNQPVDLAAVTSSLREFHHPMLVEGWSEQPGIVSLNEDKNIAQVILPFASLDIRSELAQWLDANNAEFPESLVFEVSQKVATLKSGEKTKIRGVKNIIVVSSAKGGVGKSTTSVNLALALLAQGAKVGILDADIYGPSVPLMLGTTGKQPISHDGKMMEPIEAHGLFSNSIGYLVPEDNAMVWRGPMASKAFGQLINETNWPSLDYLVVDMPPGTGDIQLSLAQQFPVTGAIVVTTPQDLALADANKGIIMFNKVEVPVVGVIENMSYHVCSQCGHQEDIFGHGGAEKLAQEQGIALLAKIPLHVSIREDIDNGKPTVAAREDDIHSQIYRELALSVASRLYWQGETEAEQIAVKFTD